LNDDVIFAHVDLYVNKWTEELGESGNEALQALAEQATLAGITPTGHRGLEIVGS